VPHVNEIGQPIGEDLAGWTPPPAPPPEPLVGDRVTLEPLSADDHADGLATAFVDAPASLWTYLPFDPLRTGDGFTRFIETITGFDDWLPYAVVIDGRPIGFLAYLRIDPGGGVIEIGSIGFSPDLQRTTEATEALYLVMRHAFDLGYRRLEWKCDALNGPSRRAADRLGFRYEGTFRQATHYKRRNRDTAWFSILDSEWPAIDTAFRNWLTPSNFDADGTQRTPLTTSPAS
jgi:RimJ/RimL family protein N-acetyltransferase